MYKWPCAIYLAIDVRKRFVSNTEEDKIAASGNNGKRRKQEEFDVFGINEVQFAIVHGRVMELLPVKTSKKNDKVKYFDCRLTNGKEVCRMVSFEPRIRSDLEIKVRVLV